MQSAFLWAWLEEPMGNCCKAQTAIQVYMRPGVWIPCIRTPHSYRETWTFDDSTHDTFSDILSAIESVEGLQVRHADEDGLFIQAISYTPRCKWLDVIEIQIDPSLTQSGMNNNALCLAIISSIVYYSNSS